MMECMRLVSAALLLSSALFADGPGRLQSKHVKSDPPLTADPTSKEWRGVQPIIAENGPTGTPVPNHRMEVRSVWTDKYLYFLYTCPYEQLYLKPNPSTTTETNQLWDFDVAEVFIGADFDHIRQYREFQVSPQSEWVDLYIDRDKPLPEGGWKWNAEGFAVKGRIDQANKIWYGEMRIPISSFTSKAPKVNDEYRVNCFRIQSAPPNRKFVAWQPTGTASYHVPEAFGRLVLVK